MLPSSGLCKYSTHHVILDAGELKTLQCMTTPFPSTAIYCRLFSVKIRGWMSGERVISIAPLNTTKLDWISLFISFLVMHVVISLVKKKVLVLGKAASCSIRGGKWVCRVTERELRYVFLLLLYLISFFLFIFF